MYAMKSRAVGMTLGVMLTMLAGCRDEPSLTAPIPDLAPNFAVGDVITVTTTSGGTELGSLRWAVSQLTGGEVIGFAPGLAGQTIVLDATVETSKSVTIEGPPGGITISGGGTLGRVLLFRGSGTETAVLRNLTITGGTGANLGGSGILASNGAGSGTTLIVENSTIAGNGNETDGASAVSGYKATLINTTVSGNKATSAFPFEAVVANDLTLINSTIAHNTSGGAGTAGVNGKLVLHNSVISNNALANCKSQNIVREGGNVSDDDSCGAPFEVTIADPMLGPLADNGGPGRTHALLAGSPAINTGSSCTVQVDQRYAPRDAACDLGAFEFADFTTVQVTMASSAPVDLNGWAVVTGTVTCSRNEMFDLRVRLLQTQKSVRSTNQVEATATTPITCGPSVRSWSVSVGASGQSFESGSALAGVSSVGAEPWIAPVSLSQSIKLYKGRK